MLHRKNTLWSKSKPLKQFPMWFEGLTWSAGLALITVGALHHKAGRMHTCLHRTCIPHVQDPGPSGQDLACTMPWSITTRDGATVKGWEWRSTGLQVQPWRGTTRVLTMDEGLGKSLTRPRSATHLSVCIHEEKMQDGIKIYLYIFEVPKDYIFSDYKHKGLQLSFHTLLEGTSSLKGHEGIS